VAVKLKNRRVNSMKRLENALLTSKYTEVYHEDPDDMKYNAPHHFTVQKADSIHDKERFLGAINFQEGPIKECGVNGVCNEDLIGMVICRLEHFQKSEFSCRENAVAITKLEEALMWLRKRTLGRENRGVEGTNTV
jgi:hypothetical protein